MGPIRPVVTGIVLLVSVFAARSLATGNTTQSFPVWGTPAAAPDAPTNLIGAVAGSTVSLSWIPPVTGGAPSSYVVEAAVTPGGPVVASLPTTLTSLDVPGVRNGTYFVRVRAVNGDGTSQPSNEIAITVGAVGCVSPPPAPGP
jgi:Fibronectin type III domain